ncbi:MAG: arginine--tRNA ligase [Candidatus Aenigmarchaeota archaeon]|nr:arginine--tRNA ligase [Candidatus Aenigmarchaeota archaeon]
MSPEISEGNDFEREVRNLLGKHVKNEKIILEKTSQPEFGDVSFPCFTLSKEMKKSPVKIAEELSKKIKPADLVKGVEAKGGYLNFFADWGKIFRDVYERIENDPKKFGSEKAGKKEKILIEYSAPNTNKPLHLGHVRNNSLGMALSRILGFSGFDVVKVNLVNDRGIHICKSMLAYMLFGDGKTPESEGKKGDHFVGDYYVLYNKKSKEDPSLESRARDLLKKWEDGDKETIELWKRMNSWTFDGFRKTYKEYGCEFDKWYYESKTYELGKKFVTEGLRKGIFSRGEEGEIYIDLTGQGLDKKILMRSDGTTVYMTQDLGTTKLKYDDFHPDRMIWVVASEQNYHFQVLFKIIDILGYEWSKKCYHLNYGMVFLPEGKMKSREGNVVDADDLLENLTKDAVTEIKKRDIIQGADEIKKTARMISLGAIKFYMLRTNPMKDVSFNPKESLSFEGDTGPFIQYSHARIEGILRRLGKTGKNPDFSLLSSPEERDLMRMVCSFPDAVKQAGDKYTPSVITGYLLDVAKSFNRFYEKHNVMKSGDDVKAARTSLIKSVRVVIRNGLDLLGIEAPERM